MIYYKQLCYFPHKNNDYLYTTNQITMKRILYLLFLFTIWTLPNHAAETLRLFQPIRGQLSYRAVRDIVQDGNGYLWIATLKGLNRYDGYTILSFYAVQEGLPSNCVECLQVVNKNDLLIGTDAGLVLYEARTEQFIPIPTGQSPEHIRTMQPCDDQTVAIGTSGGLYLYDIQTRRLQQTDTHPIHKIARDLSGGIWGMSPDTIRTYHPNGRIKGKFPCRQIFGTPVEATAIYADSRGTLWAGTAERGLYQYNKTSEQFTEFPLKGISEKAQYIRCLREDMLGNLWIGTESGLYIYNYDNGACEHYCTNHNTGSGSISDNAVYSIFRSRDGIMWIGSFFGGVDYTSLDASDIRLVSDKKGRPFLKGMAVSNITKDHEGRFWFASENQGIIRYDPDADRLTPLNDTTYPRLNGNNVHALAVDPWGYIWAGNFVDGLHRIHPSTLQVKSFKHNTAPGSAPSNNSIYKILADNRDSLILGTMIGAEVYYYATDQFKPLHPATLGDMRIDDIRRDALGNLWMATHFDGIVHIDSQTGQTRRMHVGVPGCEEMVSDNIYCCFIDSHANVWFGSSNGGLMRYDEATDRIVTYGVHAELSQRDIYAIEEDSFGSLWLSTDLGIYSFHPQTERFIAYRVNDNLILNQFNASSGYRDSANGLIYFGSINGACRFQPEDLFLKSDHQTSHIIFSDFRVFNQHQMPGPKAPLQESIDYARQIRLNHRQNSVTFDFLYIDYKAGYSTAYISEYRLEGFEEAWNRTERFPQSCSYNNLSPGRYSFQVRLKGHDGAIIEQRSIKIRIRPHILASPGMVIIYTLVLLGIAFLLLRNYRSRLRDKMALQIEHIEKNNLQELNRHKMNFFTYISHEFKTPLMILTTLFEESPEQDTHSFSKQEIDIIQHNIRRLTFLINQLMEFRTIESDHAQITYIRSDIVAFSRTIFKLFVPLFNQKYLLYNFRTSEESFITLFDNDKIEKIISNLLSNAIKHSNAGEEISFELFVDKGENKLVFSCRNSGSYIPESMQDKILQPFYKTGSKEKKYTNSGIGLALVNGLVSVLSGRILIRSSKTEGTTFRVELPVVSKNASGEEVESLSAPATDNTRDILDDTLYMLNSYNTTEEDLPGSEHKITLLLVDDNLEISKLLREKLCKSYKIRTARDGCEALDEMKSHDIDVVISDIMMPNMDGYELCRSIRRQSALSHIPIILMTSQSSKESELEGLRCGANAYIRKPFTCEELSLKINNLIQTKDSLREYYQHLTHIQSLGKLSNQEELFLKRLTELVINNLQVQNLSVDFLAGQMHISRTSLYTRLKKLQNMSITEFVNHIKIDIAKQKLHEERYSISEIAWQLGFCTPSYFAKIFKRYCGMTPIEYKSVPKSNE